MLELVQNAHLSSIADGFNSVHALPLSPLDFGWPFTRRSLLVAVALLGSLFGTICLRNWRHGIERQTLYAVFAYFSPLITIARLASRPGSSAWPCEPSDPRWLARFVPVLLGCFGGMASGLAASEKHPPIDRDERTIFSY